MSAGGAGHRLLHRATYRFERPVCPEVVAQLALADAPGQRARLVQLSARPLPARVRPFRDDHGNLCHDLTFDEPLATLSIWAIGEVERDDAAEVLPTCPWEQLIAPAEALSSPRIDLSALADYRRDCFPPGRAAADAIASLLVSVRSDLCHRLGSSSAETSAVEALAKGEGVCQDRAHLMIAALRARGLDARYVGGYLLRGATAALHAWVSLRIADNRWLDIDPTLGAPCGSRHLRVAWGRDSSDVVPIRTSAVVRALSSSVRLLGGAQRGGGSTQL